MSLPNTTSASLGTPLARDFFQRDALIVAPEFLGKLFCRQLEGQLLVGRIVEVEAYLGFADEAAHSFKGETPRTKSLFGAAGHLYVHRIHRQHCVDVVTGERGVPSSVLIRALEPIQGIEQMRLQRGKEVLTDLTTGPGKLCQALAITTEFDGIDISNPGSPIRLLDDGIAYSSWQQGPRVGLSKAREAAYRFYVPTSPYVSRYR